MMVLVTVRLDWFFRRYRNRQRDITVSAARDGDESRRANAPETGSASSLPASVAQKRHSADAHKNNARDETANSARLAAPMVYRSTSAAAAGRLALPRTCVAALLWRWKLGSDGVWWQQLLRAPRPHRVLRRLARRCGGAPGIKAQNHESAPARRSDSDVAPRFRGRRFK